MRDEMGRPEPEDGCDSCGARVGCRCDEIVDYLRDGD